MHYGGAYSMWTGIHVLYRNVIHGRWKCAILAGTRIARLDLMNLNNVCIERNL